MFTDSSKGFLWGKHQIEESILVHLFPVQLWHGHGDRGKGRVVYEEKKCLKKKYKSEDFIDKT